MTEVLHLAFILILFGVLKRYDNSVSWHCSRPVCLAFLLKWHDDSVSWHCSCLILAFDNSLRSIALSLSYLTTKLRPTVVLKKPALL
jgi:hypothetical protein